MSVIEIVRYRLKSGTTTEQAVAAWEKSQSFAKAQTGFLGRRIAVTQDGDWIDEVEWATMEDAQKAGKAFDPARYPELLDLVAILDTSAMTMTHYTVQASHLRKALLPTAEMV
ncbi:hypothetical protein [uncultured Shimia sp.]|uniref:hypothetical protein n=1 Tax=uncultured Shimia sp. TaxID=573152 RepID=UPI0026301C1E|nr:hypothetical protein [uncultured Shimia sp.]